MSNIKKELGTPTTIGQLKAMIAEYADDVPFWFRNQEIQDLREVTMDDKVTVCFEHQKRDENYIADDGLCLLCKEPMDEDTGRHGFCWTCFDGE
jgi:hypothetical protein